MVVINLDEDDGDLVEEVYENQPDAYRPIKREEIRVVLETLVRLEYDIVWNEETE